MKKIDSKILLLVGVAILIFVVIIGFAINSRISGAAAYDSMLGSCKDSDNDYYNINMVRNNAFMNNNLHYYTLGDVKINNKLYFRDNCRSSKTLREGYCYYQDYYFFFVKKPATKDYNCPNGCANGTCKKSVASNLTNS